MHVAIIMDGNGRWAADRGLPRAAGHRAGAVAVRQTVEAAARRGIDTLTLFAFSSDNWGRPAGEVGTLMDLFTTYLREQAEACVSHGIRLLVMGRRDRLGQDLHDAIVAAEQGTAGGRTMTLRLAVDYSSRDSILEAARRLARCGAITRESFVALLEEQAAPDVDVLIRTGGEQRLSDFLLWECAYAELIFSKTMWPDFGSGDLDEALAEFARRDRRFGVLPRAASL